MVGLTKKEKWNNGLLIKTEGNEEVCFYCKECDILLAEGYSRVVIGDRGPYIEFDDHHINRSLIFPVPEYHVFFEEFSSCCDHKVFIYHQVKTVSYADYKPDKWYISPKLLKTDDVDCCYSSDEEEIIKDLW